MSDRNVPRIALTRDEAAKAIGVGLTTFKQRWVEQRAERVLDDAA